MDFCSFRENILQGRVEKGHTHIAKELKLYYKGNEGSIKDFWPDE